MFSASMQHKCLYCRLTKIPNLISSAFSRIRDKEDNLVFYGGEPTLRNDLLEIISAARGGGYKRIKLLTNGRAFSDVHLL